jgi:hypothetical protein
METSILRPELGGGDEEEEGEEEEDDDKQYLSIER